MLTGEYLALDNALVLTLPTQFGQSLSVQTQKGNGGIEWTSYSNEQEVWFKGTFQLSEGKLTTHSDNAIAQNLNRILNAALQLHPTQLSIDFDYIVKTTLEFPQNWGLGSSSTLINNIAQWFSINPFTLHFSVFNGSGYDIASAQNNLPVTYLINNQNPRVTTVNFIPPYKEQLYFIHLNQKQSSYNEIKKYLQNKDPKTINKAVKDISLITHQIITTPTLAEFEELITQHEVILSKVLGVPTITEQLFSDYKDGVIKSLGAWGGDFILVTGNDTSISYFKERGYSTILKYSDMIL
jgi:mevalonate kinase